MLKRLLIFLMVLSISVIPHMTSFALTENDQFVRTANYYLMSGSALEDESTIETLTAFDLLVLPAEAQVYNEDFFKEARTRNPDIIILAYIPTVSWNYQYWTDSLHQKLYQGIEDDWWLKDGDGNQKSVWTGTNALNLNTDWIYYLAEFTEDEIMDTDLWDGVFYDEVQDSIDWISPLDINQDGTNDPASTVNHIWADRYEELFSYTRDLLGSGTIIITNGSSNGDFAPYVNGRMFENYPDSDDTLRDWVNSTKDYLSFEDEVSGEPITIINVNTNNTGLQSDYQKVRFGITTTLLGNGYFGFDYGDQDHSQLWTYDEYGAYLGNPKDDPEDLLDEDNTTLSQSVWQRDFENGKVVLNATDKTQTILLDGEYEKIHGTQDPDINDGSFVSTLTLASQDGIILLRPVEAVSDAVYLNGSFTRMYTADGNTKRTGFFAYESSQLGGTLIIESDIDLDGANETVTADDTYVYIYESDGSFVTRFAPYTDAYDMGINFAIGDIENDGSVEIVTGTEDGGGPHVRVFNSDGTLINPGFFPYDEAFRGGVRVAIGDLNGDAINEIICAAANGGGPHVRVANKQGRIINPGFFAYDEYYRGGAYVASGDINGDGIDEIISGPGAGLDPEIRIYDRDGNLLSAFDANVSSRTGVNIATTDIDGDGIDEILTFTTDVFTLSVF